MNIILKSPKRFDYATIYTIFTIIRVLRAVCDILRFQAILFFRFSDSEVCSEMSFFELRT